LGQSLPQTGLGRGGNVKGPQDRATWSRSESEGTIFTFPYPKTIRVDNGSEFISRDLELWAYDNAVTLDFSRPGKPTDNGFIEAFNSKLRAECLNAHWFRNLADAREKVTVRPDRSAA
jgi:transposase InsO family protein